MSANNFKEYEDDQEKQLPGRASDIIERKVEGEIDTTRTVLEHLGSFVEIITGLLTKMLGGTTIDTEVQEEEKGNFRADEDTTPQGTSK